MKSLTLSFVIIVIYLILKVNALVKVGVDDDEKKIRIAVVAISSLIDELSIKYHTNFKIILVGNETRAVGVFEYLSKYYKYPLEVYKVKTKEENYNAGLSLSHILLFGNDLDYNVTFNIELDHSQLHPSHTKGFTILFYAYHMSNKKNTNEGMRYSKNTMIFHYNNFFIFNSNVSNSLLLFNNVYLSQNSCEPIFRVVNVFSFVKMQWKFNSSNYVFSIKNAFYKCGSRVMILQSALNLSYMLQFNKDHDGNTSIGGYHGELANIFAEKYNIIYNLEENFEDSDISEKVKNGIGFDILISDVFMISKQWINYSHATSPMYCHRFTFLVTRSRKYTPFEKLILPFDDPTWILIIVTFLVGFTAVFIIYRLPKSTQDFVFGSKVNNPSMTLTQTFFGIGLVQTPGRNFARFLFMSFVLYCLVIRTAYQGKMYEFLAEDIRKPTIKTVQELFDAKIPIVTSQLEADYFQL